MFSPSLFSQAAFLWVDLRNFCSDCSTFPCLYGWNDDCFLIFKLWSPWWSSSSRLFCFPTSLLDLVVVLYAGGFPWISVISYVLRSKKLLGGYAPGWGLLAETFTKVTVWGAVLFCSSANRILAWPLVFCFSVILGCDRIVRVPYTPGLNGSCVSVLLGVLPSPRLFSKAKVSDFLGHKRATVSLLCLSLSSTNAFKYLLH